MVNIMGPEIGWGSWHRSNVLVLLAKHRPMIFSHMVHNFPFVFDREDHWKEWKIAMKFVHKKIKQEIILLVEDSVFIGLVPLWNRFISFFKQYLWFVCDWSWAEDRIIAGPHGEIWGALMNWTRIF